VRRRGLQLAAKLGRFLVDYADVVIAAGLALYVSYAGLRNQLEGDELAQATVAVLGVLALVILRERRQRSGAVERVERMLTTATSEKSWRVLNADMSWELLETDGTRAVARAAKEIRIEHDEVFSIYEWQSRPVGEVAQLSYEGRASEERQFREFPIIYRNLPGPEGRTYNVISLEGMRRRGQRMTYCSERLLEDSFTEARENVSVRIEIPTDHITLTVVWPKDRKPHQLEVERSGRVAEVIDLGRLKRAGQGRTKHVERISSPRLGETIVISWQW